MELCDSNKIIQVLWWGPLNELEQLSIRSYLRHGHEVHLYSYGPVWNVPLGTIIKDAEEIVPFTDKERFWHLAQFSDWFRYNLLLKRGGWWVDLDTICLRPFDLPDEVVITQEDYKKRNPWATNCYMKAPAGHPMLQWIVDQARVRDVGTLETTTAEGEEYIAIGPVVLTEAVQKFGITLQPSHQWNYLNSSEDPCWLEIFNTPALKLPADAYAVHLYRTTWRNEKRYYIMPKIDPKSWYGQLREDYKPKVLIACSSCWRDKNNGGNQAIRDTWAKDLPADWDLRFFIGGRNFAEGEIESFGEGFLKSPDTLGWDRAADMTKKVYEIGPSDSLLPDEVLLPDTPDGYLGLSFKTRDSLQWAIDSGYTHIFRIFVDTYIIVERLVNSGFELNETMGWIWHCGNEKAPSVVHPDYEHTAFLGGTGYWLSAHAAQIVAQTPVTEWAEDAWIGYCLHNAGIPLMHDNRFPHDPDNDPKFWKDRITLHLGDRHENWGPDAMYKAHELVRTKLEDLKGCKKCGHGLFRRSLFGAKCRHCGTVNKEQRVNA